MTSEAKPVAWVLTASLRDGTTALRLPLLRSREEADRYQKNNPDETLMPLYAHPVEPTEKMVEAAKEAVTKILTYKWADEVPSHRDIARIALTAALKESNND